MKYFPFYVLLVVAAILLGKFAIFQSISQKEALPYYNELGNFVLENQNAEKVDHASLEGRVWIADFIFTRCGGPCPDMAIQMKKLHAKLSKEGVGFLSFSVDPQYDTPEILKRYIKKLEIDDTHWFFLTGDQEKIHELSIQHFLLGVTEIPEEQRVTIEQGFNHSTKFALVDKEGFLRGYYDSLDSNSMRQLARDAKALAKK
jgi:protein SCO1/2